MSLNIILPCAGKGSRLGLSYPKEIHQIDHDVRLIDLSLLDYAFHTEKKSIELQLY
jgi:2-C-methyl-D-erythritol 4-phosphate cytidylyltransferase